MTDPEMPHIIETEIIQTIQIDNIRIKDHEITQLIDQNMKTVTTDYVTILEIKILNTQLDQKFILSHHVEITHKNKTHNKSIEAIQIIIEDK